MYTFSKWFTNRNMCINYFFFVITCQVFFVLRFAHMVCVGIQRCVCCWTPSTTRHICALFLHHSPGIFIEKCEKQKNRHKYSSNVHKLDLLTLAPSTEIFLYVFHYNLVIKFLFYRFCCENEMLLSKN
jgi:hypothetical protein